MATKIAKNNTKKHGEGKRYNALQRRGPFLRQRGESDGVTKMGGNGGNGGAVEEWRRKMGKWRGVGDGG